MLNKVILIGNVGRDPESFGQESKIAKFSLATTEKTKVNGEAREFTEWHQVVAYGKMAETVLQYVRKGSKLFIEGKITTKHWEDRTGQKMYRTEIELRNLLFMGSAPRPSQESAEQNTGSFSEPEGLPF